jgi:hypothetical protein
MTDRTEGPGRTMLCEPENGIHRYVTPATATALDVWRRQLGVWKRARNYVAVEHGCTVDHLFKTLSIEPAVEMPPLDHPAAFYVVWTEQVVTERRPGDEPSDCSPSGSSGPRS